jgi:hypothetical protein
MLQARELDSVLSGNAVALPHDQLLNQDPSFNVVFNPKVLKVNK